MSPVFTSISKENYHPKKFIWTDELITKHSSLLLEFQQITFGRHWSVVTMSHFIIWKSNNPIENFKSCLQIALS
jgi:hypothetical protein